MEPKYKSRLVRSKLTIAERKKTIRRVAGKLRLPSGPLPRAYFFSWSGLRLRLGKLNRPGGTYTYKIENKGRMKRYLKSRKHLARQKKRAMVAA